MLRKKVFILGMLLAVLVSCTSCTSEKNSTAELNEKIEQHPDVFIAGQQDALEKLEYSAWMDSMGDWDNGYVKIEDLIDVLERLYDEETAYEIRDLMNIYTTSEILEDLIDEYKWEE